VRQLENLSFSPSGIHLAASDRDGPIELWDTINAKLAHTFPSHTHHDAYSFQFNAVSGQLYAPGNTDGIVIHDPITGKTTVSKIRGATVARVAVSPDAKSLLYYNYSPGRRTFCRRDIKPSGKTVPVWSVPLFPPETDYGWTRSLQYLSDGTRFCTTDYTGGKTNRIAIRSVNTGDILQTTKIPHGDPWGMTITSDAKQFAVRGGSSLMVWRADRFEKKPTLLKNKQRRSFTGMAFHPSGRFLAATSGEMVTFFDMATDDIAFTLDWKIGKLGCICFSPDGLKGAVGSHEGRVVVWDVDL
jgi:WD40 repeat protein